MGKWPEWKPIETAPRDGEIVLLTDGRSVVAGCFEPSIHGDEYPWAFVDDYAGCNMINGAVGVPANAFRTDGATHWMPLPLPPAPEGGE